MGLILEFRKSPIFFIKEMWGLVPQPLKLEYRIDAEDRKLQDFTADMFEKFEPEKHITWQQWLILLAVEDALKDEAPKHISVGSGHGIGKSAALSWLILWFLFSFKNSQVPCTAPTSDQMHDILWKELALWLRRMPQSVQGLYKHTDGYLRITESPETWFARAKTAKKEAPEALAGVHGDWVMYIVDEASGVPDEVYKTAEGALTNKNILFMMISNPTRLIGYFYDSHHKDKDFWQCLQFSSKDSPIVEKDYVSRMAKKHGEDSDEYRIRVLGMFPKEDMVDAKGYVPLLTQQDLRLAPIGSGFTGRKRLGVDPAGDGDNETRWVIRDNFKAKVVAREATSNAKSIAAKTLTLMTEFDIAPEDVVLDNFGEGANVAMEIAIASKGKIRISAINTGDFPVDRERFLNCRAEIAWRARMWLRQGGEVVPDETWEELLTPRYRRELSGLISLMPKKDMRREGFKSPDTFDAFSMTFYGNDLNDTTVHYEQPEYQGTSEYEG